MSEVCQVKIHLLGKLQEKSLTWLKNCESHATEGSPRKNLHVKFGNLSLNA